MSIINELHVETMSRKEKVESNRWDSPLQMPTLSERRLSQRRPNDSFHALFSVFAEISPEQQSHLNVLKEDKQLDELITNNCWPCSPLRNWWIWKTLNRATETNSELTQTFLTRPKQEMVVESHFTIELFELSQRPTHVFELPVWLSISI